MAEETSHEQYQLYDQLESTIKRDRKLAPRSKALYVRSLSQFRTYAGPDPRAWKGDIVEQYHSHLLTRGLTPKSVNAALQGLRWAFRKNEKLLEGLHGSIRPLLLPPKKQRPALSLEQVRALVATCEGTEPSNLRDRAALVVGFRTGMRRGTLCSLEVADDWQHCPINLPNGTHTICMDHETISVLEPWLSWVAENDNTERKRHFVFRGLSRQLVNGSYDVADRISEDGLFKALKRRAQAVGIDNFKLDMFRYSYVALAMEHGVPQETIVAMTGHTAYRFATYKTSEDGILPSLVS